MVQNNADIYNTESRLQNRIQIRFRYDLDTGIIMIKVNLDKDQNNVDRIRQNCDASENKLNRINRYSMQKKLDALKIFRWSEHQIKKKSV